MLFEAESWWQSDVAFIESPQRRICKTWAISGTVSRKMSSNCGRCLTQPKPRAGAAEKVQASKIVEGNSYQIWNGPRRTKESSSFQAISFKYTSSRAGVMWPGAFEILALPRLAQPPIPSLPIWDILEDEYNFWRNLHQLRVNAHVFWGEVRHLYGAIIILGWPLNTLSNQPSNLDRSLFRNARISPPWKSFHSMIT